MFVTLVINVLVLLPWHPLGHAVMSGFTVAVLAIPLCMYFVGTTKIVPVEALTWSWVALRRRAPATVVFGLLAAGGYGLMFSSTVGLVMSLPALVGLAAMRGIVPREALGKIVPNEGMVQSGFNALAFGIAVGLLTGGSFSLLFQPVLDAMYGRPALLAMHVKPGWPTFWGVAGAFGCIAGLTYGGIALGMHIALRLVVAATTPLPLRLQPFLDYAVERTLLRRVGAGYIFPHRALLEYFAERAPQPESRT
jgi:hypothetical protein